MDLPEWKKMCGKLHINTIDCQILFKAADTDGDGKCNAAEWDVALDVTLAELAKYILAKFKDSIQSWAAADKSGDGKLDTEEWKEHCAEVQVVPPTTEKLFKEVDVNGDGVISEEE